MAILTPLGPQNGQKWPFLAILGVQTPLFGGVPPQNPLNSVKIGHFGAQIPMSRPLFWAILRRLRQKTLVFPPIREKKGQKRGSKGGQKWPFSDE